MNIVRILILTGAVSMLAQCSAIRMQRGAQLDKMASTINEYAAKHGYNTRYSLLMDMRLESGRKRFFIYDQLKKQVIYSGLVAHGSCSQQFLKQARFSNVPGAECSSLGLYRVGSRYSGRYGRSYKLYGLQASNANAYSRAIVLHAFSCVPDEERYPRTICNSSGCPMVSYAFLDKLSGLIDGSGKPLLLWIFDRSIAGQVQSEAFRF